MMIFNRLITIPKETGDAGRRGGAGGKVNEIQPLCVFMCLRLTGLNIYACVCKAAAATGVISSS